MIFESSEAPETIAAEPYPESLTGWQKKVHFTNSPTIFAGTIVAAGAAMLVVGELWPSPNLSPVPLNAQMAVDVERVFRIEMEGGYDA